MAKNESNFWSKSFWSNFPMRFGDLGHSRRDLGQCQSLPGDLNHLGVSRWERRSVVTKSDVFSSLWKNWDNFMWICTWIIVIIYLLHVAIEVKFSISSFVFSFHHKSLHIYRLYRAYFGSFCFWFWNKTFNNIIIILGLQQKSISMQNHIYLPNKAIWNIWNIQIIILTTSTRTIYNSSSNYYYNYYYHLLLSQ